MTTTSAPTSTDTATTDEVAIPVRLAIETHAAGFIRALGTLDAAATKALDRVDFDARLRELIRIRVSQLNGCAYCLDMHTTDARAIGETDQRLTGLPTWRETPFFSARERAALQFAESVTLAARTQVPAEDYEAVAALWSPDEIAALLALVTAINAWTTVGVATRAWTPGSYQR